MYCRKKPSWILHTNQSNLLFMTSPLWLYYSWFFSAGIGFPIRTALSPTLLLLSSKSWVAKTGYSGASSNCSCLVAEAEESLEYWTVQWDLSQKSRDKTQVTLGSISSILSQAGSLCSAVISSRPEFALSHAVCSMLWVVLALVV